MAQVSHSIELLHALSVVWGEHIFPFDNLMLVIDLCHTLVQFWDTADTPRCTTIRLMLRMQALVAAYSLHGLFFYCIIIGWHFKNSNFLLRLTISNACFALLSWGLCLDCCFFRWSLALFFFLFESLCLCLSLKPLLFLHVLANFLSFARELLLSESCNSINFCSYLI